MSLELGELYSITYAREFIPLCRGSSASDVRTRRHLRC